GPGAGRAEPAAAGPVVRVHDHPPGRGRALPGPAGGARPVRLRRVAGRHPRAGVRHLGDRRGDGRVRPLPAPHGQLGRYILYVVNRVTAPAPGPPTPPAAAAPAPAGSPRRPAGDTTEEGVDVAGGTRLLGPLPRPG